MPYVLIRDDKGVSIADVNTKAVYYLTDTINSHVIGYLKYKIVDLSFNTEKQHFVLTMIEGSDKDQ
jgi:hypothetical protein